MTGQRAEICVSAVQQKEGVQEGQELDHLTVWTIMRNFSFVLSFMGSHWKVLSVGI